MTDARLAILVGAIPASLAAILSTVNVFLNRSTRKIADETKMDVGEVHKQVNSNLADVKNELKEFREAYYQLLSNSEKPKGK